VLTAQLVLGGLSSILRPQLALLSTAPTARLVLSPLLASVNALHALLVSTLAIRGRLIAVLVL
jgi:hypothetical protein